MLDFQQTARPRAPTARAADRRPRKSTPLPPFRIKVVDPIEMSTAEEREAILRRAEYNLFRVPARQVMVDLLTDSGTSALSSDQWSRMMRGDESYAGASSWYRFEATLRALTEMPHILPAHQGRACERILFSILGGADKVFPGNNHFDTTRGNIEHSGATALDLVIDEGRSPDSRHPFKGNIDLSRLADLIDEVGAERIPACVITVTNNSGGGQPVSLENLQRTRALCRRHGIPLILDAARYAENAYFVQQREPGQSAYSVREIAAKMFACADGAMISAKKDGLVNIGGVMAMRDDELARKASELLILTEGYVTYGGLAGRDLDAMATGFEEALNEDYLRDRVEATAFLANRLIEAGVEVLQPVGGHAVYVDAAAFLPHLPPEELPGQALACALYRHAGVRSVEIGKVMFDDAEMQLVRLAIPRRVYTREHLAYVADSLIELADDPGRIRGLRFTESPAVLRHFTARFAEVER